MNLEREIKINKILLILLITLSVGTIAMKTSHAMFSKKETFNNVLRIITASELPSKGAEDLIEKAGTGEEEIQGIDPETGELCSSDCKEYRYTGPSVKNYVKLTNLNPTDVTKTQEELWRIIGVFTDEDNGEKFMRIVRNSVLAESYLPTNYVANGEKYTIKESGVKVYWNYITSTERGRNNWATAGIQYYLNGEQDSLGNKGYMSYLSDETKKMLRDTKHYLGTFISGSSGDTPLYSIKHEKDIESCKNNIGTSATQIGCRVYSGNAAVWIGKISLMYPSDVGYAVESIYRGSTKLYDFDGTNVQKSSWMLQTMDEARYYGSWLISPTSNAYDSAAHWGTIGYVRSALIYYYSTSIRPVLNLKSSVKIISGTGISTDPYILTY